MGKCFGRANGNSREVPRLEYRGGGVFNALDYRDGAVFVTSQEAVALVADQTAEETRIHPAAPVSFPRAKTAQSEGKGGKEPTQHDARAAQVRAALGGVKLEGIKSRYGYRFAKRAFDILFSALVLVCFSWLFVIIAILIKIDDPKGPVFFKQKRVGKLDAKGNPTYFTMYKFRSMCVDAESKLPELRELNEKTGPVFKIADDPRVTRVGKWLRKLSLDELPQFVNALKGDISIVGPRPALPAEVATYNDYQKQRLLVKPGITCYWQTRRNRDSITFDEWVDLDLLYVKQCSPWADFKLVIQTVGVVLTAQGN